MTKVIEKRKGNLRGNHLPKGEVVPLMSDSLFKKVYADSNHLERLNYLLSIILKKDVKVIRILNDELIGDSRLNRKKSVDLVCQIDEGEYVNIEINTSYAAYEKDRNLEFLFRLASADYKPDISLPKEIKDKLRKLKKHYLQINFNTVNTNNKPFTVLSIIDNEDVNYKLTNMIEILNINVSYYRDLCYTRSTQELSDLEIAIGMMGVYQEKMLNQVSQRNKVLKEIGEIVKKYSFEDDVIVAYDREEYLKEAYEANLEYAVEDAIKETTESTSKKIARNMLKNGISASDVVKMTGLTKQEVEALKSDLVKS